MYLLEHDAKSLLRAFGVPVPEGVLLTSPDPGASLGPGPWVVKGQIAAGGRGKAGLIRRAQTPDEVRSQAEAIFERSMSGRRVESVRVERQVTDADEMYLALLIDETSGQVRVMVSEEGGMEIDRYTPRRKGIGVQLFTQRIPANWAALRDRLPNLRCSVQIGTPLTSRESILSTGRPA